MLRYEPSDFVKVSSFWVDHIHPEDAPRILAGLSVLFESRGFHVQDTVFYIRTVAITGCGTN